MGENHGQHNLSWPNCVPCASWKETTQRQLYTQTNSMGFKIIEIANTSQGLDF